VEIAKALSQAADLIVMDEPSAILAGSELDQLFDIIAALKAQGVTIVSAAADHHHLARPARTVGTPASALGLLSAHRDPCAVQPQIQGGGPAGPGLDDLLPVLGDLTPRCLGITLDLSRPDRDASLDRGPAGRGRPCTPKATRCGPSVPERASESPRRG